MLKTNENFNFIIIGAGRGGTSLLAGVIDSHPELEVGFEQFANILIEKSRFYQNSKSIISQQMNLFRKACINEAKNYGRLWGNKITTEQILGNQNPGLVKPEEQLFIVRTFFETLQDVKIIFILRDGKTCIRSKVNRTNQPIELACLRWKFSVEVYKYCLATQNTRNMMAIKFEDLLIEPEPTLKNVCNFLDVHYEEKMLQGTNNSKMIPDYRNSSFDRSKLISERIGDEYYSLIEQELRFCNYL